MNEIQYGSEGTPERNEFERNAETFILAERLKEERLKAGLTQEQLAQKIGTAELNKISSALRSFLVKGLYLLPNNTYICLNKVNESM